MDLFYIYLSETPYCSLLITYSIIINRRQNSNHKINTSDNANFMIP